MGSGGNRNTRSADSALPGVCINTPDAEAPEPPAATTLPSNQYSARFYYLPLQQHSEDSKIQEMSMKEHDQMFLDLQTLINEIDPNKERGTHDEEALSCGGVLRTNKDAVDIPIATKALDRGSTEEEMKFLAAVGEMFESTPQARWLAS
jgi:hypothetical protein